MPIQAAGRIRETVAMLRALPCGTRRTSATAPNPNNNANAHASTGRIRDNRRTKAQPNMTPAPRATKRPACAEDGRAVRNCASASGSLVEGRGTCGAKRSCRVWPAPQLKSVPTPKPRATRHAANKRRFMRREEGWRKCAGGRRLEAAWSRGRHLCGLKAQCDGRRLR